MWNVLIIEEFVVLCMMFYYFIAYTHPLLLQVHTLQFRKIFQLSRDEKNT